MIKKLIASAALVASLALLAPAAASADDAFYTGPVYPWSRVCVDAWGTSANASGWAQPGLEFIVRVRAEGSTVFNFLDAGYGTFFGGGTYYVAGGGTFRLCARNTNSTTADVSLFLSTS
jgi:hypothetical protein